MSAGLGQASSVGALSVPYGWTTADPEIRLAAEALPSVGVAPRRRERGKPARRWPWRSPMGVSASENRPLPIVIVRPPQSTIDRSG
ncbi:hypothetical protein A5672_21315 [Mycobacterium alsense]|uniref:PPE family C-terminal domain-containing protein n=1 Tax=Mycobacterium alsense TaxID=324058 RepID=A0ABD6P196_9MYCO|nr:hypothetical protein A5672_21315 [Mycobacterium alsense]